MTYDLYDGNPPHVNTDTSFAAAKSIEPSITRLARMVKAFVIKRDGATCDEVEVALGLTHQTASARIRELVLRGQVHDGGERRKTRSGRSAIVWIPGPGKNRPDDPLSLIVGRVKSCLTKNTPISRDDIRTLVKAAEQHLKWSKGARRKGKGPTSHELF
jgi:hypothetical protein